MLVNCWPTPGNNGTCEVNIEYELENEHLALHDVVISIPLPSVHPPSLHSILLISFFPTSMGSYPTVSSHVGDWALNPSSHTLDWYVPRITPEDRSASLEFSVGGEDASVFFPVKVSFVGQGSVAGVKVASASRVDGGGPVVFSTDCIVTAEDYRVV